MAKKRRVKNPDDWVLEDHMHRWFVGNEAAVTHGLTIFDLMHQWDDIEDEGARNHNRVASFMGFGLRLDPFFSRFESWLLPSLLGVYLDWSTANRFDRDPEHVHVAYTLRAGFYRYLHVIAWLCGGEDHAQAVGPEIWRFYTSHETLDDLRKEMECPVQQ